MVRERWAIGILALTVAWVVFLLLSLHTGWLHAFFFDTDHAAVQGIDFFPICRGWLNLLHGTSEFDSFRFAYGPYATWLYYHPLEAVVMGAPLSVWQPWTAYRIGVAVSVACFVLAAVVLARRGTDPLRRALVFLLLVGSFPAFLTWYSGNIQAQLVLAVALVFAAVDGMRDGEVSRRNRAMLLAGLLLSLFSKPFVLVMLPMLLLLKETRRTVLVALAVYVPVSLLSLLVPAWNPVALPWVERWSLLTHPAAVAQTMNVYTNHFVVTRPMMDNAVHWLAMVGLADFRFLHVDVYSLPALLDGWLGTHTPAALFRVPLLLVLETSVLVALMRDRRARLEAALMTLMAAALVVFLSYGLVWEYHYTLVLPIAALLLVRGAGDRVQRWLIGLGVLAWLPGTYVLLRMGDMTSLHLQTVLRAERVLPVLAMFALLLGRAVALALRNREGLRWITAARVTSAAG